MLESLQAYRARTAFMWDSLPRDGRLCTGAGLARKVNPDGSFRPFCGDTVIFTLPQDMVDWLAGVQAALYDAWGECLAERIAPDTFHITLHDLLSQPETMPEGTNDNRPLAQAAIRQACAERPSPIGVRSCSLFSMVGTSLVMGFEPSAEADCAALMGMYERFQRIVPLGYPLTLHVTLAYYKPGEYSQDMLHRLRTALASIGRERREWRLDMRALHYAAFTSMAQYRLFPAADP